MEPDLALAQRVAVVGLNLSVSVLVGAGAATLWLRRAHSPWAAGVLARLRTAMLACFSVALATTVAVLWFEAASMAEVPLDQALPAVESVITATHYGSAWMLGAGALILAWAATAVGPRTTTAGPAAMLRVAALGVFLYSRSIVSHAGAAGDFTWAVAVDWLHLVLVSVWVGEVIVAAGIVLRGERAAGQEDRADCARYVEALSASATVALAGIFITGLLSAWRGLGSPDQLVGNPYANVLVIKVALVLCAAALGGANRFLVMPALLARLRGGGAADAGPARFALILKAEAIVLLAVMIAAAILSSTPPPTAS